MIRTSMKAGEAKIFAEEAFVVEVQSLIQELMDERGINRSQLADILGVSKARVSQIFSDNGNVTVKTLAGAAHALGDKLVITSENLMNKKSAREEQYIRNAILKADNVVGMWTISNDDQCDMEISNSSRRYSTRGIVDNSRQLECA